MIHMYMSIFKQSCSTLKGIGKNIEKKLNKYNIYTISDLLFHIPYKYQDKTKITLIKDIIPNHSYLIVGKIINPKIIFKKLHILCFNIVDNTGIVKIYYFNIYKKYIKIFKQDKMLKIFGKIKKIKKTLIIVNPSYKFVENSKHLFLNTRLTPVYPSIQGINQNFLRKTINNILIIYKKELMSMEWMSKKDLNQYGFYSFAKAINIIHNPYPNMEKDIINRSHSAIQRLIFDELFSNRYSIISAKNEYNKYKSPILYKNRLLERFLENLPFTLTQSQQNIIQEISIDLSKSKTMIRLIHGDVGSGKTIIAIISAFQAISSGYQVAFMTATELLSEQHTNTIKHLFSPFGFDCFNLSKKIKHYERIKILKYLKNKKCKILIGTHAIFQEKIEFSKLGLIIIDEQHRFGVKQRLSLINKGTNNKIPHQLFISSTPIPRTLSMIQSSYLKISKITELPMGRLPIITKIINQNKRKDVITRIKSILNSGKQIYWICTTIKKSKHCMDIFTITKYLKNTYPNINIDLIHGNMDPKIKEQIIHDFQSNKINILVATTIVEVGIDITNANTIIIENAERLGLSQLHQLRGRVGRSNIQSYCILLYRYPISQMAKKRLEIIRNINNGFIISNKDLQLRGEGDILGTQQIGFKRFKFANTIQDGNILNLILKIEKKFLERYPKNILDAVSTRWIKQNNKFLLV